jgi:hypothetical protein
MSVVVVHACAAVARDMVARAVGELPAPAELTARKRVARRQPALASDPGAYSAAGLVGLVRPVRCHGKYAVVERRLPGVLPAQV